MKEKSAAAAHLAEAYEGFREHSDAGGGVAWGERHPCSC